MLCGLPRKNHAAIGSLPSSTPPLRPMVLRRFRPHPATSPRQQDRRSKRNRQGREERSMRTGLGTHPHSAAYPHLAPAAHPYSAAYSHLVSGLSSALGDITKVRRKE